jgi:uncharacterized protein YuzE
MLRKFSFDYDPENDSLFLYDAKSKSKASIELGDVIIDFNSKKEMSGIELLEASKFFSGIEIEGTDVDKKLLNEIQDCMIEVMPKGKFLMIKMVLLFGLNRQLATPVLVPMITEPSPALAVE